MILVFDLDDTLYDEFSYVTSGMKAVAAFISEEYNFSRSEVNKVLMSELSTKGRGKVFDETLNKLGCYSKKNVHRCLRVYRSHNPSIELSSEGKRCLERFQSVPKYLVTDGNKWVQQRKINALKISHYFKKTYRTYQYGLQYSKPSTWCFQRICKLEGVKPGELVYIGDNPNKDFVNLKKEGFKTIRLRRGMFKDVNLGLAYEAHFEVKSLDEITSTFLKTVFSDI